MLANHGRDLAKKLASLRPDDAATHTEGLL